MLSSSFFVFTFLLCFSTTFPEPFLLCNKQHLIKHYHFDNPVQCLPQKSTTVHHCSGTIYHPTSHLKPIVAYFCFTKEIRWTTHFYFFGSKVKETKTVDAPPPTQETCNSWAVTKNTRDGRLVKTNDRTYHTENKVNYEYTWPTATSGIVRNHFIVKSIILYDFFQDTISSPILPLSDCHISMGHCRSQTKTVIWKTVPKDTCPYSRKLGKQTIQLFYNSSSLYRIEIPNLSISIHKWSPCPIRAQHCFPKDLFCTLNGIYIVASKCHSLGNLTTFSPKHRPSSTKTHRYPDPIITSYIDELEDRVAELADHLNEQHHLLQCQLERNLGVLAKTLAKIFPTEILSLALAKPSFGIAAGDVIIELACSHVAGKVMPSLALGKDNKFSLLPLVQFEHPRTGKTRIGQLVSPNYIIEGKPSYYETYTPGRSLVFRVNSRFMLFEIYTASHHSLNVAPRHVPLTTLSAEFPFSDILSTFSQLRDKSKRIN